MDYCDACSMCRSGWTNMCLAGGGLGTTAPGALAQYVAVNEPAASRCRTGWTWATPAWSSRWPASCTRWTGSGRCWGGTCWSSGPGRSACSPRPCWPCRVAGSISLTASRPAAPAVRRPADRRRGPGAGQHRDVVVDATGSPAAVADGFAVTRRAGRIALLGVSGPGRSFAFEPFDVVARELTVVGSTRSGIPSAGRPGCSPRARCRWTCCMSRRCRWRTPRRRWSEAGAERA